MDVGYAQRHIYISVQLLERRLSLYGTETAVDGYPCLAFFLTVSAGGQIRMSSDVSAHGTYLPATLTLTFRYLSTGGSGVGTGG